MNLQTIHKSQHPDGREDQLQRRLTKDRQLNLKGRNPDFVINMSRPILSRPRTRVYGCNYDKGESYYKPMVDHLDRKYSARPLFSEPRNSFADEIAARRSDIGNVLSRLPKWFWWNVKLVKFILHTILHPRSSRPYVYCSPEKKKNKKYQNPST